VRGASSGHVFDFLRREGGPRWGRLDEITLLEQLYDLDGLPSTDPSHATAAEDIVRHRVANVDWDDTGSSTTRGSSSPTDPTRCCSNVLARMAHPLVFPEGAGDPQRTIRRGRIRIHAAPQPFAETLAVLLVQLGTAADLKPARSPGIYPLKIIAMTKRRIGWPPDRATYSSRLSPCPPTSITASSGPRRNRPGRRAAYSDMPIRTHRPTFSATRTKGYAELAGPLAARDPAVYGRVAVVQIDALDPSRVVDPAPICPPTPSSPTWCCSPVSALDSSACSRWRSRATASSGPVWPSIGRSTTR
jgi:AbiJ N-terminal domain 3